MARPNNTEHKPAHRRRLRRYPSHVTADINAVNTTKHRLSHDRYHGHKQERREQKHLSDNEVHGTISRRNFNTFLLNIGATLEEREAEDLFDSLDKINRKVIAFDDFYGPFLSVIDREEYNLESEFDKPRGLKNKLITLYTGANNRELRENILERWKKFADFKRVNMDGACVMRGGSGIVADVHPGGYTLAHLSYFKDLPPVVPKHVAITGVIWINSDNPGMPGSVIFPKTFHGHVPVEIATHELLRCYGASLANGNHEQVNLSHRYCVQDFNYGDNYISDWVTSEKGLSGSCLETHAFHHMDCPLVADSGVLVLAKWAGRSELHVTGFRVPVRQTVYLPGHVIHSNDYLRGVWRTMLSDEAQIVMVRLLRRRSDSTAKQPFLLDFYE